MTDSFLFPLWDQRSTTSNDHQPTDRERNLLPSVNTTTICWLYLTLCFLSSRDVTVCIWLSYHIVSIVRTTLLFLSMSQTRFTFTLVPQKCIRLTASNSNIFLCSQSEWRKSFLGIYAERQSVASQLTFWWPETDLDRSWNYFALW